MEYVIIFFFYRAAPRDHSNLSFCSCCFLCIQARVIGQPETVSAAAAAMQRRFGFLLVFLKLGLLFMCAGESHRSAGGGVGSSCRGAAGVCGDEQWRAAHGVSPAEWAARHWQNLASYGMPVCRHVIYVTCTLITSSAGQFTWHWHYLAGYGKPVFPDLDC